MKSDWTLQLSIRERHGSRSYHMAVDLDIETFGERLADDMKAGLAFAGPGAFEETVSVLKERQFGRDLLERAATMLGKQLADHLEDREGWHGIERQEALQAAERKRG
jgi:hypothetical protein